MNDMSTAVNEVKTSARAKSARGRPALKMPGGKSYAEAKSAAKAKVLETKRAKADAKKAHKPFESAAKEAARKVAAHKNAVDKAQATLAKSPKDATLKLAFFNAKANHKTAATDYKAASKALNTSKKAVDKATAAYDAASKAVLKVEENKRAAG